MFLMVEVIGRLYLLIHHFDYMRCKIFVDFFVPWNRL